jgi:hypothetical protein
MVIPEIIMDRTEDQILTNEPFQLAFGDATYPVKRLPIGRSKAWRKKVLEVASQWGLEYFKNFGSNAETTEQLELRFANFKTAAGEVIDKYVDLVADYCEGQITREQIEAGNEEQLFIAYQKLVEVAFPLGMMTGLTAKLWPRLQA